MAEKRRYIDGDYEVIEYESGSTIRVMYDPNPPKNSVEELVSVSPLKELQEENAKLKSEIELIKQALDDLLLGGM